jgi:hypothetical protein
MHLDASGCPSRLCQYAFGCIPLHPTTYYLDASGCIWMHLDASGCIWMHLDASGCSICEFGCFWMHPDAFGNMWMHLVLTSRCIRCIWMQSDVCANTSGCIGWTHPNSFGCIPKHRMHLMFIWMHTDASVVTCFSKVVP